MTWNRGWRRLDTKVSLESGPAVAALIPSLPGHIGVVIAALVPPYAHARV